jgi:hypothetical protein
MSGAPFNDSALQGLSNLAQNAVAGIAEFLKAILEEVISLVVQISIPLAVVLLLTGSILYFSHLNRRLGRDFVILSIILAIANQMLR